jgi:hypothetical protein
VYFIRLPTRRDLALSADHCDARSIAIFVDVNPKCSRFLYCKCEVWGIDFIQVAFPQFAHAKVYCPLRDTHLQDVFVQIQEGKRGHATQVQRRLPGLQFRARILIGPEFVPNRHWAILRSGRPIFRSSGLERHISIQVANARNPRWRVAFIGARFGRD